MMVQTVNDAKVQKRFEETVGKYITDELKEWLISKSNQYEV